MPGRSAGRAWETPVRLGWRLTRPVDGQGAPRREVIVSSVRCGVGGATGGRMVGIYIMGAVENSRDESELY